MLKIPSTHPPSPSDLLAGLAVSSAVPRTPISAVPSFHIVPPSPDSDAETEDPFMPGGLTGSMSFDDSGNPLSGSPLYPSPKTWRSSTSSPIERSGSADRPDSPLLIPASAHSTYTALINHSASTSALASPQSTSYPSPLQTALTPHLNCPTIPDSRNASGIRPLAHAEARQLTLIIRTTLSPVARTKGLKGKETMQASIDLALKLHRAGLMWDGKRRVMGIHLRGVLEGVEGAGKGEVAVEYVKGSFVSSFPDPHPLDEFPLDLELPTSIPPAAPTPTVPSLANGLAKAMGVRPVPPSLSLVHSNNPYNMSHQLDPNPNCTRLPKNAFAPPHQIHTGALTAIERTFVMAPLGATGWEGRKGGMGRLRGMKKGDLWVKTALPKAKKTKPTQPRSPLPIPISAASLLTPSRMMHLMSASSGKSSHTRTRKSKNKSQSKSTSKAKDAVGLLGIRLMDGLKGIRIGRLRLQKRVMRNKEVLLGRRPTKVRNGSSQLVLRRRENAVQATQCGEEKEGVEETFPISALPSARRVSVTGSGWQLR